MEIGKLNATVSLDTSAFDKGVAKTISGFSSLSNAAMGMNQALQLVQQSAGYMVKAFDLVKDAVEDYKLSVIKTSAIITSKSGAKSTEEIAAAYKNAKMYAEGLYDQVRAISKETMFSSQDNRKIVEQFQLVGVNLDLTTEKAKKSFAALSNALAVVTAGSVNKDIAITSEMRALLRGQLRPGDEFAKYIASSVPDFKKVIQEKIAGGGTVFLEWIATLTKGFEAARGDIANTWSAIATTWESLQRSVIRGGLSGAFQEIIDLVKRLNEYIKEHSDDISRVMVGAWETLKGVLEKVQPLLAAIFGTIKNAYDGFMTLPKELREYGIIGTAFFGLKGFAVMAAITEAAGLLKKATGASDTKKELTDAYARGIVNDADLKSIGIEKSGTYGGIGGSKSGSPRLVPMSGSGVRATPESIRALLASKNYLWESYSAGANSESYTTPKDTVSPFEDTKEETAETAYLKQYNKELANMKGQVAAAEADVFNAKTTNQYSESVNKVNKEIETLRAQHAEMIAKGAKYNVGQNLVDEINKKEEILKKEILLGVAKKIIQDTEKLAFDEKTVYMTEEEKGIEEIKNKYKDFAEGSEVVAQLLSDEVDAYRKLSALKTEASALKAKETLSYQVSTVGMTDEQVARAEIINKYKDQLNGSKVLTAAMQDELAMKLKLLKATKDEAQAQALKVLTLDMATAKTNRGRRLTGLWGMDLGEDTRRNAITAAENEKRKDKNATGYDVTMAGVDAGIQFDSKAADDAANFTQKIADMTAPVLVLKEAFNGFGNVLTDVFMKFQETGKFDFSAMIGGMLKTLQLMAAQKTAALLMEAAYQEVMVLIHAASDNPIKAGFAQAAAAAAWTGAAVMGSFVLGSGLAGMAHSGIDNIPEQGTWLLNKNERVVDSKTNQDLKSYLKGGKQGTTMNITINGGDEKGIIAAMPKLKQMILDTVNQDVSSNGATRKTIMAYAR